MDSDWPGRKRSSRRGWIRTSVRSIIRRSTDTTSASHQSGVVSADVSAASTMILAITW